MTQTFEMKLTLSFILLGCLLVLASADVGPYIKPRNEKDAKQARILLKAAGESAGKRKCCTFA